MWMPLAVTVEMVAMVGMVAMAGVVEMVKMPLGTVQEKMAGVAVMGETAEMPLAARMREMEATSQSQYPMSNLIYCN